MKTYQGNRTNKGNIVRVVVNAHPVGYLSPRHDLGSFAPVFDWGNGTSGARQLALAICADATGDGARALRVAAEFSAVAVLALDADAWEMNAETVLEIITCIEEGTPGKLVQDREEEDDSPLAEIAAKLGVTQHAEAAKRTVSIIDETVKAAGFTDAEAKLASLAAHFRATQGMLHLGVQERNVDLIMLGSKELAGIFARTLGLMSEEQGVDPERLVACARLISETTESEAKKHLEKMGVKPTRGGDATPGRILH